MVFHDGRTVKLEIIETEFPRESVSASHLCRPVFQATRFRTERRGVSPAEHRSETRPMTQNPPSDTALLLNLTTDDVFTTQMALHYANAVLEAGYPVTLFLNVRAVTLADKTIPQHTPALMEETSHNRMRSLLERGATIYACKQCSVQAGVNEDNWLEGIEPGDIDLVEFQMDPNTKVMTY
jgi:predicted peroxiredoxin